MNPFCLLARQSIEHYLKTGKILDCPKPLPQIFKKRAGVFVSIHKKNGELRGCIGTFLPTQENLAQEIIKNSLSAATQDPRFSPLTLSELKNVEISVDILSQPMPANNLDELNVKKYGVIVKSADGRSGLLLPDIEGIKTPTEQITIACQKAGIFPDEPISIYKFTVKRYKE